MTWQGRFKAVATGAVWTRQMKHDSQYAQSPNCTRCVAGLPETLCHWAYQCEGNRTVPAIAEHGEILLQAEAHWDQAPLLYGRGRIPQTLLPAIEVNEDARAAVEGPPH